LVIDYLECMQLKKYLIRLLNVPFRTIFFLLVADAILLFVLPLFDILSQESSPILFYLSAILLSWIGCFCFIALLAKLLKENMIKKEIHLFVIIPSIIIILILFFGPLLLYFLGISAKEY
jgi:hypothetical protein